MINDNSIYRIGKNFLHTYFQYFVRLRHWTETLVVSSSQSKENFCLVIHSTNHVTKCSNPSLEFHEESKACDWKKYPVNWIVVYYITMTGLSNSFFVNIFIIIKCYYFFIRSSISIKICYGDDCLVPILWLAVSHVSTCTII